MPISRRAFLSTAIAAPAFIGSTKFAQAAQIRYLLTSPSPIVAEAPHSSVPEVMGFWKEGGIDVGVKPFNGSTGATQLVLAGSAEFTMASPEGFMAAREAGEHGIAVYSHTREPIYSIAVVDDSPIKKLEQLKGKTIGVLSLSSGAVPVAKAMLRSIGYDPEKDVKWLPVGLGPQTANALKTNQVDALALWDWGYAILENLGYRFRQFTTPETSKILSLMLIANEDFVKSHRAETIKMAQGVAKGALFTITNPEAAVRIHWSKYPGSKPASIPEEQALKEAVHILTARLAKYHIEKREVPKWGAFTKSEWEATQSFLFNAGILKQKIDVSRYYTDEFVAAINDFDAKEVVAKARSYK
jgi:NitT/TauT family transport system substrate-binding protein